MNFQKLISIVGGAAATADPRTAPQSVPEENTWKQAGQIKSAPDFPVIGLAVTLEGTATQTASVELFALDETAPQPATFDAPFKPATTDRWYKLVAATTITVGTVAIMSPVAAGRLYLRVATSPAADATLKIAPLPRS